MTAKRRDLPAASDLFALAAALVFVVQCVLVRRFRLDDAFIAYRYARNLGDGLGPVMNAGERVEGVSNLPWTALLGAGSAAGLEPHGLGPVLSWSAGFLVVGLLATLAARALKTRGAGGPAALLGAAAAPIAVWSVSGMETLAFTALCTGFFLRALGDLERKRSGIVAGLWLGGVACLRPEGLAYFLPLVVAAPRRWRWLGTVLGLGLAALVMLTLGRWLYYGSLLPNPVHAKASLNPAVVVPGLLYVTKAAAVFPLFSAAVLWMGARGGVPGRLLLGWCGVTVLVALAAGGERFPGYRLLVPALPAAAASAEFALRRFQAWAPAERRRFLAPALCLAALGLAIACVPHLVVPIGDALLLRSRTQAEPTLHAARLVQEFRCLGVLAAVAGGGIAWLAWRSRDTKTAPGARAGVRGPWAALAVLVVVTLLPGGLDPALLACRQPDPAVQFGRPVGDWLRRHLEANALVATNCAGSLPYAAALPVLDMLGLTDAHIARTPPDRERWIGHEKGDGAYVLSRRPDIIILGGPQGSVEPWPFPGDLQLAAAADFQRDYVLRRVRVEDFDFVYYERSARSSR